MKTFLLRTLSAGISIFILGGVFFLGSMVSERRMVWADPISSSILNIYLYERGSTVSEYLNPNDEMFYALLALVPYSTNSGPNKTIVDINGDGLNDVIYHHESYRRLAVFLNNGGSGFHISYQCKYKSAGTPQYQGDCADPDRPL